jgi:hypothetical protein
MSGEDILGPSRGSMSDLTNIEKRSLERLLGMGSGYVLDFSNRTFDEFVLDSIGKSIYAAEYETGGGSKANRLRALWSIENNHLVGKLLSDLLEYASERQVIDPAHKYYYAA